MDKKAEDLKKIMKQHKHDLNAQLTGSRESFSSTRDLFLAFEDLCRKIPDKERRDRVIENMRREPEDILVWNKDLTICKACWGTELGNLITLEPPLPTQGFLEIGDVVSVLGSPKKYKVTGISNERITLKGI